jgi:hypothetical protein
MLSLPRWCDDRFRARPPRRKVRPGVERLDERALPSVSALSPVGPLQGVLGSPFSGALASFSAADVSGGNIGAALPHLHASINWGDGNITAGTIGGPDGQGNLTVSGTHNFTAPLTFPVTIQVTDDRDQGSAYTLDLVSIYSSSPVTGLVLPPGLGSGVTSSNLGVTPVPINASAGQVYTGIVGVVQDAAPGATGANLAAVIDWGDGTQIDVVPVQPTATPGVFDILASHFYPFGGSSTAQIWVQDLSTGWTAATADAVTVAENASPPPASSPGAGSSSLSAGPSSPSQPQGPSPNPGPAPVVLHQFPDGSGLLPGGWVRFIGHWAFTRHGHHRVWRLHEVLRSWAGFARW